MLIALGVATGCALVDGKHTAGRLLTSWSQGTEKQITEFAPKDTLVLADDASRRSYLSGVPDTVDTEAVSAADLRTSFLVLDSYGKCMEQSRVWMDSKRTRIWFEVDVPRKDRNTMCGWSPITVDIWQVPRSELRGTPAEELRTDEPA